MQPQHPGLKQMDAPLPLQQMHTTPPLKQMHTPPPGSKCTHLTLEADAYTPPWKQMHTPHPGSRWIHPTHTNTTNSVFSSTHNPQCVQVNTNTQPTLCSIQHTAPHCVQPNTMLPALNCVELNTPPIHQHFTHTVLSEWALLFTSSTQNTPTPNIPFTSLHSLHTMAHPTIHVHATQLPTT